MAGLRGLAGDTVWYGLSSIIGRMITYFLTPLYTGVLAKDMFGVYTEFYAYVGFLYAIYTFGMETSYFRYASKTDDPQSTFNVSLSSILVVSISISGALCLLATPITELLEYQGQEQVIYWLSSIIAIDAIVAIPYAKLRREKKPRKFAFIRLFNVSFTVLLNLFFYAFCLQIIEGKFLVSLASYISPWYDLDFQVKYIFLSNLIANASVVFLLYQEFKGFRFSLNREKLQPMIKYAMPLLIMSLAVVTNEMLSRTILKYWLPEGYYPGLSNQEVLGIFGACYKLSVFMLLGIQAFRYAAEPFFFSHSENKNSPQLFTKVMTGFIIFNCLVFYAVSVNLKPIGVVFLTNPEYREAIFIVPILLMGYLFSGINYNLSVWYKLTDQTKYGAIITSIGAIITIALNYYLIPVWGYLGSAIATFATFFTMATISYILGRKYYPIPYDLPKALEYLVLSSIGVAIIYPLELGHWFLDFVIKNLTVILFIAYIYFRERKQLSGIKVFGFKIP
ncbi:lipopolysaccharide biosynthesis protein [Reichenbachiella ulvae]|uniref:Polysaccharide biosynthesis C-terminal domain-containing protein n=1 Tax=Reichenbachiella ulvae TaxID=2980104 RepID=A0ABT3CWC6_9BACT|nr:polysaccharide biosynthesis C-terminal domain-containing protein [Reichenbachiella ulvae]MCV9388011.1 polysaccharide biosynthesis C-terminal domain-containing protein [Reichenbachiella ulvae]